MLWRRPLKCSFCGRSEDEVKKLVAGPKVTICDECVAAAARIMEGQLVGDRRPSPEPGLWQRLVGAVRNLVGGGVAHRERVGGTIG